MSIPGMQRFLHHLARRETHASEISEQGSSAPVAALLETGKLLKTLAMLPAETLQLLRMVSVPLLDTTLALPGAFSTAKFFSYDFAFRFERVDRFCRKILIC